MRRLAWALAVLAALSVTGAVLLGLTLDPLLKRAVEALGPQAAGVPVTLGSVSVSPFSGRLYLKGLVVGNPPGFKTPSAFELGEARVSVSLRSLLTDRVVVKEVLVRGASATYELGPGGSNLAVISRKAAAGGGAPAEGGGPSKRVVISDFRFEGATVRVSASLLGGGAVTLPIPDVHLKDVGGRKGTSPAHAAAEVVQAVASAAAKAALASGRQVGETVQRAAKAVEGLRRLFK